MHEESKTTRPTYSRWAPLDIFIDIYMNSINLMTAFKLLVDEDVEVFVYI